MHVKEKLSDKTLVGFLYALYVIEYSIYSAIPQLKLGNIREMS